MATTLPWDPYSSTTEEVESDRCTRRLDEIVTADYAARVVGHGDDEVDDDVVCEKLEEVVSIGEILQALFDDAEERVQRTKVFNVTYQ